MSWGTTETGQTVYDVRSDRLEADLDEAADAIAHAWEAFFLTC